jgi:hypothetical protein
MTMYQLTVEYYFDGQQELQETFDTSIDASIALGKFAGSMDVIADKLNTREFRAFTLHHESRPHPTFNAYIERIAE